MVDLEDKICQRALADLSPPGVPNSFRRRAIPRENNIAWILNKRERGGARISRAYGSDREEQYWAESESTGKHESQYFDLPPTTKSTISIAISPDGKTFASTHGDHTVKIICMQTGRILQTLVGHPRTPWSVKFHPTDPRYVASGCLGFQVRFWDIETGRCLYVSTLRHAIISISFHPSGDILAIASGTCVYTWDYQHTCPRIALFSYQTLRSVTFLPDPTKIMVGEANERYMQRPIGQNGQSHPADLTVTLTLWDFDPSWALSPQPSENTKAMNNSREILSHALIYNDGGFDISRCGRYLAICADFSLRQAEKDSEMEAASDVQQILSTAPQDPAAEEPSNQTEHQSESSTTTSSSSLHSSLSTDSATSTSEPLDMSTSTDSLPLGPLTLNATSRVVPQPSRLFPTPPFQFETQNMFAVLQSAAAGDPSLNVDHYLNSHVRRVRPRLHPSVNLHRTQPVGSSGATPVRTSPINTAPAPPQRFSSQIRPNIAVSRNRYSRFQRTQRSRLAAQIQSTWLALISLDPQELGRVVQTCHLEETTAGGVTSVKLSPTSAYVLLGYGVRDRGPRESDMPVHRVTRIYRWENMELCSHVESELDDVNIALFSPICGGGFLYGTKQGKLRVCSTYRGRFEDHENCNMLRVSSDPRPVYHISDDEDDELDDEIDDEDVEDDDMDGLDDGEDDDRSERADARANAGEAVAGR